MLLERERVRQDGVFMVDAAPNIHKREPPMRPPPFGLGVADAAVVRERVVREGDVPHAQRALQPVLLRRDVDAADVLHHVVLDQAAGRLDEEAAAAARGPSALPPRRRGPQGRLLKCHRRKHSRASDHV